MASKKINAKATRDKKFYHQTILIVEDDKDMHVMYKDLLSKKYNLIIAKDTAEARAILSSKKINLMILDIILPRETGDTFFVRIKELPKYKNLKVIIVTILGDVIDPLKKIDPAVTCVPKPFSTEQLLAAIEKRLNE